MSLKIDSNVIDKNRWQDSIFLIFNDLISTCSFLSSLYQYSIFEGVFHSNCFLSIFNRRKILEISSKNGSSGWRLRASRSRSILHLEAPSKVLDLFFDDDLNDGMLRLKIHLAQKNLTNGIATLRSNVQ